MTTIAHYRKPEIWRQLAIATVALTVPPYLTFWSFGGHLVSRIIQSPRAAVLIPALLFVWVAAFMTCATIIIKINQLVFHSGVAVWIDRGKLVFTRSWYVSIPCDEIADVSVGLLQTSPFVKFEAVAVHLRDGGESMFPTTALLETRDTIIARLRAALNLAGDAQRQ